MQSRPHSNMGHFIGLRTAKSLVRRVQFFLNMKVNKKRRLRRKFVDASESWLQRAVPRHIGSGAGHGLLHRTQDFLVGFFENGARITLLKDETDFLKEKLVVLTDFVSNLEAGNLSGATKIAKEKLNRELTREEVIFFLNHYRGRVTVLLSQNNGASIKLEG